MHKSFKLPPQEKRPYSEHGILQAAARLMLKSDFKYFRVVGHKVRLQASGDKFGQFSKIVAILLGKNDASDAASFGLKKNITHGVRVVW